MTMPKRGTTPPNGGAVTRGVDAIEDVVSLYQPVNLDSVAQMLLDYERAYRYLPTDDLEAIIAHAELVIGVAIFEGEVTHGTEYLDVLHSQRLAAVSTLARREVKGYRIDPDAGGFDRDYLENLKLRASIALLLEGRGVQLRRVGRGYIARCPLPSHNDRSPSFHIYTDTQTYHCFGCGAHGDILDLIMILDNLTFPQAVEEAARMAGVAVPERKRPSRRRVVNLNGGSHAR